MPSGAPDFFLSTKTDIIQQTLSHLRTYRAAEIVNYLHATGTIPPGYGSLIFSISGTGALSTCHMMVTSAGDPDKIKIGISLDGSNAITVSLKEIYNEGLILPGSSIFHLSKYDEVNNEYVIVFREDLFFSSFFGVDLRNESTATVTIECIGFYGIV